MNDEENKTPEVPIYETFKKRLKCALGKTEIAKRSEQLMALMDQQDDTADDAAIAAARYKEEKAGYDNRIEKLKSDIRTIRDQIKTGEEIREVEVKEIPNHESKMIELHRLDVSAKSPLRIVSERPMDLLDAMESTPEATDEAHALADAATDALKPKKKAKGKPEPKAAKPKKEGKPKRITGPNPDMSGVEDMEPLVSLSGRQHPHEHEV